MPVAFGPQLPGINPTGSAFPQFSNQPVNTSGLRSQLAPANVPEANIRVGTGRSISGPEVTGGFNQFNRAQAQQSDLYNAVLGQHDTRVGDLLGRNEQMANATRAQQAAGIADIGGQWGAARTEALDTYGNIMGADRNRLLQENARITGLHGDRSGAYSQAQLGAGGVQEGYQTRLGDIDTRQNQELNAAANQTAGQLESSQTGLNSAYAQRTQQIADLLSQRGQSASRDIDREYDRSRAESLNDMTSRGLSNTTVLSGQNRGIESDRSAAQQRLRDTLRDEEIRQLTQVGGEELQNRSLGIDRSYQAGRAGVGDVAQYQTLRSQLMGDQLAAQDNTSNLQAQLSGEVLNQENQSLASELGQRNDNRRELEQLDSGYLFPQLSFQESALGNQVALGEDQRASDSSLSAALSGDRLGFMGSRTFEAPSLAELYNIQLQSTSEIPQPVQSAGRSTAPVGYSYATPTSSRVYTNNNVNYSTSIGDAASAGSAARMFDRMQNNRGIFGTAR